MIINGVPQKKPVFRQTFTQKKPLAPQNKAPLQSHPTARQTLPSGNFNDLKQKVISYIRASGPVIPIQIAKAVGSDTMFAGAVLSELISNRILKITSAKIGGSPVYYIPGQEEKLDMLKEHLGKIPKQAYELLKEHLIMRDSQCEPWQRIALRELKDFAMPIPVRHEDGSEEIFWRWHLLSEDDARDRIKAIVEGKAYRKVEESKPEPIKPMPEPIEPNPEPIKPVKPDVESQKTKEEQTKLESKEEKAKAEKPRKPKKEKIDAYKNELLSFLQQKGLEVLEEVGMKKGEYAFVVKVESALGKLSYLAIAKKKKKLSDDDVLLAYSAAQHHKLPLIVIAKELSKKAEALIAKEARGVAFLKL
ncbi:MAG: hypothetical protein PHO02_06375 [Candidatus Nanoarchaeia archaeon]|nr:hypothetical protein [Candidatus Nanoarchaeia archaeon]